MGRKTCPPWPASRADSQISTLISHNAAVGVRVVESWEARNTRLDIGWAAVESGGVIGREDAVALGSMNF
jgi:hypothetical protein